MNPPPLNANDILALWSWIALFSVSTGVSFSNARKNAGRPLATVWYTMAGLCGWWLLCAILGLFGGPFVLLYRIGIGVAILALALLYMGGKFKM